MSVYAELTAMIDGVWLDLRFAWRGLRRAPSFCLAVVLMLGLGLAGATSMFALIEGILLRPLAVPAEDQLAVGWRQLPNTGDRRWSFKASDIETLRTSSRLLDGAAGIGWNDPSSITLGEGGSVVFIQAARVTGDFFRVLGARPMMGRVLTSQDDAAGAENVLVLTHGLWQRRYGGSRDVLGRRETIGGQPFTIVGVMPPDVEYPRGVDAWAAVAAMQTMTSNPVFKDALRNELDLLARVRSGSTVAQGAAELRVIARALEAQRAQGDPLGLVPTLMPFKEALVGDLRPALMLLFAAVGVVLFIASANAASLMVARGEARRAEFAVRAALGGGRARLVRQALFESAILVVVSGMAGLLAAQLALRSMLRFVPGELPRTDGVAIGGVALLFTVGLAAVVAAAAGLVPALASLRVNLASDLRDGRAPSPSRRRGTRALVVSQVAVAVVVVAGATLLARSLLKLQAAGDRLDTEQLVLVSLDLPESKYADRARRARFMADLVGRLESAPGVTAATPVNGTPFSGLGWEAPTYTVDSQTLERGRANASLSLDEVHPNYFRALDIPIVRGRAFTSADREGAPLVAIISEDVAARTWPGVDPIGQRLKMGDADSDDPWRTIVGVVAPTRFRELREERAALYVPAAQLQDAAHDVVVRTSTPVSETAGLVRRQVRLLDGDVQVQRIRSFAELLGVPLAQPRFHTLLIAIFAGAALVLLSVGLYAVIAAYVRERRQEIGVRMALGATTADVHRLVAGEGARLTGAGAALGFAAAIALAGVIRGLLFEIEPFDPLALGSAALVLTAVAVLSLYFPVRTAGRVDPAATLRS